MHQTIHEYLIQTRIWKAQIYRLFVWLRLSSLALSGLLDVIGRQPADGGGVLVVRPQLTELLLAVQPQPQMPIQCTVVAVVNPGEMPAHRNSRGQQGNTGKKKKKNVHPYLASWW